METCGLKGCEMEIGPGAAKVRYSHLEGMKEVVVCSDHAWMLMTAQPGMYRITDDMELKALPAYPTEERS